DDERRLTGRDEQLGASRRIGNGPGRPVDTGQARAGLPGEPEADAAAAATEVDEMVTRLEAQLREHAFEALARHEGERFDTGRKRSQHFVEKLVRPPTL